MGFTLSASTRVIYDGENKAIRNAADILRRDIRKKFTDTGIGENNIVICENNTLDSEEFIVDVSDKITVFASDELGFVYGLLYISEKFLGIKPFWFWMDQVIEKTDGVSVENGQYKSERPAVRYRGWFINDEVLIMKWAINGDTVEPWRMAFEALLRCGGNLVIPGTDKNSRKYRQIAADMGLWITHHHAEPLGAEMFAREYPDLDPNYDEYSDLFIKLWEEGVKEQKDNKTVWCLGFRGQGDCPFWSHDKSGKYDTDEKRGALISDIIALQKRLVEKYVENPVFCTNLYGEVMELYEAGHITIPEEVIKISADNGYGKMVTRRRDNHTVRISSMPKEKVSRGGIYYHVSFYDLQAANHITMLPNSVNFVNNELTEVMDKGMTDYWLINCSNVRPHTYYLDAVRKKWYGRDITDEKHSSEFADEYYGGNAGIAGIYRDYYKAMASYGKEEDEHAGEQFYTENIRLFVNATYKGLEMVAGLRWLTGEKPILEQIRAYSDIIKANLPNINAYFERCLELSKTLSGNEKRLFDATILMQTAIYKYCSDGVIEFAEGYEYYDKGDFLNAFMRFGNSAREFGKANDTMRGSEYGVWQGFYFNDCFADIKHTSYMLEKIMGLAREKGDNARHDKWYREAVYAPRDRKILTLLINDNHMTDWELYEVFKKNEK